MRELFSKLWIMVLCRVLMAAGFSLSFPFLALYLNKERGVPMHWIGTFLSLSILASAVSQTVGGGLADRFGRKRVMLAGLAARTLAIFALALAIDASAPFLAIMGLHFLNAVTGGVFDPANSAWISDRFRHDERVQAYGLMRSGGNLGWAVGPAIGGLAAGRAYGGLFLWTGAVYAAVVVLVALAVPESEECCPSESFDPLSDLGVLKDPRLLRLSAGIVLMGAAMSQLIAPLSLFSVRYAGLTEWQVGMLFSMNGAMVVVFQLAWIHLLRGRRLTSLMVAGALLYAVGYGSLAFLTGFWPIAAAVAVVTVGEITITPAVPALTANLAKPGMRGRYLGAEGLASQLGWAVGPFAGGWGLEFFGPMRPCPYWLGVGCLTLGAAWVFWGLRRHLKHRDEGLLEEEPPGAGGLGRSVQPLRAPASGGA